MSDSLTQGQIAKALLAADIPGIADNFAANAYAACILAELSKPPAPQYRCSRTSETENALPWPRS